MKISAKRGWAENGGEVTAKKTEKRNMLKEIKGGVCAAKGFKANGVHCGIRKNKSKRDLALIYSETQATAAAVYTKNLVKGAPLTVTKNNIADGKAQAVICNSGNANTCNANGIEIAEKTCALVAEKLGIKVFLLTDCLINRMGADIGAYPNGSFPELMDFIRSLQ
jgi:N-acetylglutamate synthase/N-acetylornithine aminotransferase